MSDPGEELGGGQRVTTQPVESQKEIIDEIAAAVLALQTNGLCGLGRVCELCDCFSDGDGGAMRDEILRREAKAAYDVVVAKAEALAQELDDEAERIGRRPKAGLSTWADEATDRAKTNAAQRLRALFSDSRDRLSEGN